VQADVSVAFARGHGEVDFALFIRDMKFASVVDAGEDSSAGQTTEHRIGVTAENENAFAGFALRGGPFDGDAMGGVLAGKTEDFRDAGGAHVLETDQAESRDGVAAVKFGAETAGQEFLHHGGADAEIHEQTAEDEPFESGDFHG
jgi:hypothetical protein